MTPKKQSNFRIDAELLDGLEAIRSRDPEWSVSRQVREAIKDWLRKQARRRRRSKSGSTKRR